MKFEINELVHYIISFLIGNEKFTNYITYEEKDDIVHLKEQAKIVIVKSSFFDKDVYGTKESLPKTPFDFLPDTDIPFLFGESCIEKTREGKIILYADLVASAYFMLSRYEEIIKTNYRDQYGRFLAKDAIVFQQGFGLRPIVDEWGRYLRNLLRQVDVEISQEKHGFSKIFLTHDIDKPFYITTLKSALKNTIKYILRKESFTFSPIKAYFMNEGDPFYTFKWLLEQDNKIKKEYGSNIVEDIYFIISAKSTKQNIYYSVTKRKYKKLLKLLVDNKSTLGIHISHEGGINPETIQKEVKLLPNCVHKENLLSRNHYLRWREPDSIEQMQTAGIKEDFTLGYADSVGFRVGTCRPYRFINPNKKTISNIIIHPMEIMECSLFDYMKLDCKEAELMTRKIIDNIFDYNGEFVLLYHNSSFYKDEKIDILYKTTLEYLNEYKKI